MNLPNISIKFWKCQSSKWTVVTPLAHSLTGGGGGGSSKYQYPQLPTRNLYICGQYDWRVFIYSLCAFCCHFLYAFGCLTLTNSIWQRRPDLNNYVDGQRVRCQGCLGKSNKTVIVFLQLLQRKCIDESVVGGHSTLMSFACFFSFLEKIWFLTETQMKGRFVFVYIGLKCFPFAWSCR